MIKGKLNNNTKDILKEYYVNYYLLKIQCNFLKPEDHRDGIEKLVDDSITYCMNNNKDRFFKYVANKFNIYRYNNKLINMSPEDIYNYSLQDNYFKNIFKEYYVNVIITNTKLNAKSVNNEQISKLREMIINEVDKAVDSKKSYLTFRHTIANKVNSFLSVLDIKGKKSKVRNDMIEARNGNIKKINYFKRIYVKEYVSRVEEFDTKLTNEELKKYFKACIPAYIDSYFKDADNKPLSTLRTYLEARVQRITGILTDENTYINYVRRVPEDYDRVYAYYLDKLHYLVDGYAGELIIKEYERLVKYYIDNSRLSVPMVKYVKNHLNMYIKDKNKPTYNIDLVLSGDKLEKAKMIRELYYLVEHYKDMYPYFDTYRNVTNELEHVYIKAINSYFNSKQDRPITSYIHGLLKPFCEKYYYRTIKNNSLSNLVLILRDYTISMDNYKKAHRLSLTDKANLDEYMGIVLEDYISKGKYVDNKKFFDDKIDYYHKNLKR